MSQTVTKTASTRSNDNRSGSVPWTIDPPPTGGTVANVTGQSYFLKAIAWGFAIPRDATLAGVTITMTRSSDTASAVNEWNVCMLNGAGTPGSNLSDMAELTTTPTAKSYGSTSNKLGMEIGDLNSPVFGFEVQVVPGGGGP